MMSIKFRIFGGFIAILFLTVCVAGVAWRSLDTYAGGAQTATAAQKLASESGRLALVALHEDSVSDPSAIRAVVDRVEGAIGQLAASGTDDPAVSGAIEPLRASLRAFAGEAKILGERHATKLRLQEAHRKLVEQFQTISQAIGRAQKTNLDQTAAELDASIAQQAELSNVSSLAAQATRITYELRLLEAMIVREPDGIDKAQRQTKILKVVLSRLAATPSLSESAKAVIVDVGRYGAIVTDIASGLSVPTELFDISAEIQSGLGKLDGQILNLASSIRTRMQDARDHMARAVELLATSAGATVAARTAEVEELELFRTGSEANAKSMDAAAATLFDAAQDISFKVDNAESARVIGDLLAQIKGYRASIPDILASDRAERASRAAITRTTDSLSAQARGIGDAQLAQMDSRLGKSLWLLGGGVALALTLGIMLSLVIGRSITKPVLGLVTSMRRLAAGDLTVDLSGRARRDEVGQMIGAVSTFKDAAVETIRVEAEVAEQRRQAETERAANESARGRAAAEQARVVDGLASGLERLSAGDLTYRLTEAFAPDYEKLRGDFNAAVGSLQSTMRTIATTAGGIRSNTGEISQAADDLSRRTEQQAASLEETAAALDEITATVNKTAEGASHARGVVANAKNEAGRSGEIVRRAITAMGEIERSSGEIAQIIGVIDEIAFQTNLLALNAGVEAARAGEAGRGFAVVASEVRALAQRSAEAAKDIKVLIRSSGTQVGTGVQLVGEAGDVLTRIAGHVEEINDIVGEIAASAREQATGLAEVNTAVNQMDQMTQANAAMTEQSTAASHSLAAEAEELDGLVGKFALGGDATRRATDRVVQMPPSRDHRARPQLRSGGAALSIRPANDEWEEF